MAGSWERQRRKAPRNGFSYNQTVLKHQLLATSGSAARRTAPLQFLFGSYSFCRKSLAYIAPYLGLLPLEISGHRGVRASKWGGLVGLFRVSKGSSQPAALLLAPTSVHSLKGHSRFPITPKRRWWWVGPLQALCQACHSPSTFPKRRTTGTACHHGCTSPQQTLSALACQHERVQRLHRASGT